MGQFLMINFQVFQVLWGAYQEASGPCRRLHRAKGRSHHQRSGMA